MHYSVNVTAEFWPEQMISVDGQTHICRGQKQYLPDVQEASKNRNVSMYSKYIGLNQNDVGKKSVETAVD